ncbi:hypothetical protein ACS0TY_031785 [Phlomoides rotata]
MQQRLFGTGNNFSNFHKSANGFQDRRFAIPAGCGLVLGRNYSNASVGEGSADNIELLNDVVSVVADKAVEAAPVLNEVAIAAADSFFPIPLLIYQLKATSKFDGDIMNVEDLEKLFSQSNKVMEVFVKAAEFLEIPVRRSDDEPLHKLFMTESCRSFAGEKGYGRLKNLQRLLRMRQQYTVSQVSLLYLIKTGKIKAFLRVGQMADLDARRALTLSNAAKKIQRKIITHIARSHFLAL